MNRLDVRWVIGGIIVVFVACAGLFALALIALVLVNTSSNTQLATATARAVSSRATAQAIETQAAAGDTDNDGLLDAQERALGTDPRRPDSDGDGLADGLEVNVTGTNPLDRDTDNDGLLDGAEAQGAGAPTALPTIGSARPTLVPVNPGGSDVVSAEAAAQAVVDYYALVSRGRYDQSWPLLSDHFKQIFNCCAPDYNYGDYVAWWDSVDYVSVEAVRVTSQQGNRVVVYAELDYHMVAGGVSRDRDAYIEMINDNGVWRFYNKGASPNFS